MWESVSCRVKSRTQGVNQLEVTGEQRSVCISVYAFMLEVICISFTTSHLWEFVTQWSVWYVVYPAFWVAVTAKFWRFLTSVGRPSCFASSCCVKTNERNSLKNRMKSLVSSDFIRKFARYLCVTHPRVRVSYEGEREEWCVIRRW